MKTINSTQIKQWMTRRVAQAKAQARAMWQEMTESDAPAGTLAVAFAIGTLISTIPVPLVDMALAAYVMRRFAGRLPRAPFFGGMAVANNLIMAPLYASTPKVGGLALGWLATHTPLEAPEAFLARILVGYLLIAAGLALGSFVLAQTGFRGYHFTRRQRAA
jgi:hypothetical protein